MYQILLITRKALLFFKNMLADYSELKELNYKPPEFFFYLTVLCYVFQFYIAHVKDISQNLAFSIIKTPKLSSYRSISDVAASESGDPFLWQGLVHICTMCCTNPEVINKLTFLYIPIVGSYSSTKLKKKVKEC